MLYTIFIMFPMRKTPYGFLDGHYLQANYSQYHPHYTQE